MAAYEVNQKMTNLANAIREKTGKTDKLSLDAMTEEILSLSLSETIAHADIPSYVKNEALNVVNKVQPVLKDDSIVFMAMSDTHHYGEQADVDTYPDANGIQTNTSNLHSAMAAKILSYVLDFDFVAHLGDSTWGNGTTTSELLQAQITDSLMLLKEPHAGIPCFHAIGNHDTGIYYHNAMDTAGASGTYTESGDYLYNKYTALSESENTVIGGEANGGYCYRDFSSKKLRVFLLNTSEALIVNQNDGGTLGSQRIWFANALLDLNSKEDAADWGFIVLSHYPADYGNTMPLSELLKAYVEGGSITVSSEDGTSHIVDFASANMVKFIAQFHGHVHNFKAAKLNSYATGSGVEYDAWRICIPNGQYNRENYYTSLQVYPDIDFSEETNYSKTPNTSDDTSFVVNVINPSEEKIYSFCYGAGRDRTIGYGDVVYHNVTSVLSNLVISGVSNVETGKSFYATLTPDEHCVITSVVVTMNGEDITTSVYADGVINISSVTGDVVVTASAEIALACTNQIPISTDESGNYYNSIGYKSNTYVNNGVESSCAGVLLTGFIPVSNGDIIRLKNMSFTTGNGNHRIMFYDSEKNYIAFAAASSTWPFDEARLNANWDANGNCTDFTMNTGFSLSINESAVSLSNTSFIRICCADLSSDSILTVNEEIKYADEVENTWSIFNELTHALTDNHTATVNDGASYSANISAISGYVLNSVVITMNGVDITDSVYADGVITINKVTGNVVISVVAISDGSSSYINEIPISTSADGSIFGADYNGDGENDGYLAGYRLNSSGNQETYTGTYVTGFIPCTSNTTVYMKNVTFQSGVTTVPTSGNQRLAFYAADRSFIKYVSANEGNYVSANYNDTGDVWVSFTIGSSVNGTDISNVAYFRIAGSYIGEDSIISVGNEIT